MQENDNKSQSDENSQETAGDRLRRILLSSKKEQKVKPISEFKKSENKESDDQLDDTQPIRAQPSKTPPTGVEEPLRKNESFLQREKHKLGDEIRELFSEFGNLIQGIFQSIGKLPDLLRKRNGSKFGVDGKRIFPRIRENPKGCLLYGILGSIFLIILIGILSLSFLIFQYFRIASGLPSVDDLRQYASQFETTRIYDRNNNLIYEILDPNAGRRSYISLENISPYVIASTIATEDKDFYTNPGFDPWGIMRALWQNYTTGRVVSGASTITQQLARSLLLSPEERSQITTQRKAREIVLAAEITRNYIKDEILELYLNEIYYGNIAYGIEAAAETYFNTSSDQLNLAQASFLAGLPQSPAIYDIFTNRESTLLRHQDVLNLMYQLSSERGCIDIHQSVVPICVTLNEAVAAAQEIENYPFAQRPVNMPFPHWVNFIRSQLEQQFDPQTIYRSGFRVYTTLDPDLQNYAQQAVKNQVEQLAANDATDGALVAIRPATGEILAMVGSSDFFNEEISGQVNMAVAPRQPGSSIKPVTYAAAFEKGWTPATLIWDVPSEFPPSGNPDDPRDPYKPVNYDGKFHGPVLARTALGSSYNVPAVKTLDFVGIYDNPDTSEKEGLIAFAERMGITTLTRDDYGLALTLGGGDVSLLELTGAYATFANGGLREPPFAINKIEDHVGEVVFEHQLQGEQIIRADHAFLINDILSDNGARTPAFGSSSILRLPFRAAVKTGTTNDFRDNWTLGYIPELAIGVWIGNADYTPMKNISGVTGAAPLWADVMQWEVNRSLGGNPTSFTRPSSIEDQVVCSVSGARPSDRCPNQKSEIFAQGQPPLPKEEDLWKEIEVDTWTNLRAGSACSEYTEEKMTLNITEKWAKKWILDKDDGKSWAKDMGFSDPVIFTPTRECRGDDPKPTIVFVGLSEGMNITASPLDIYAVISATEDFDRFRLQYGVGNNPGKWQTLLKSDDQFKQPKKLVSWDVYEADATRITLRIYIYSSKGTFAEKRIHLNLNVPTLTPTVTPTLTETPEPTWTLIPTETLPPVPTNTSLPVATDTPTP
ncbi:MAG TPA: transglycosylase domain-containing protein [Pelolinea sp.]|nr:transglycosylase domain-containing protein [Pelolinea sp.]